MDECGEKHEELGAGLTKSGAEKSHRGWGLFKMVFGVDGMASSAVSVVVFYGHTSPEVTHGGF